MSTRKIKDAKDLSSNELIYFKGHAKATYMSDGSTVEDSINLNKLFVEDNYYNKSNVDKKITEAITGGLVSLDGFATEQWVNEQGFLKEHQDISHLAKKSELPTKVSELENDSKFITIDEVPEVTVPTKTSDLTNDSGFITKEELNTKLDNIADLETIRTNANIGANSYIWSILEDIFEYVDLGLPSGTLWATHNVGATKPEEYGDYYAWGETEEKENYEWSTYKWCNGSEYTLTKYCTYSNFGKVDNKTTIEPSDDVASIEWGDNWRMPTKAELDELINNCTWTYTTLNGVKGHTVTGTNGNSIFLPAAGCRMGRSLYGSGSEGYYWSCLLYESCSSCAYHLHFFDTLSYLASNDRNRGRSVRPVYKINTVSIENETLNISNASYSNNTLEIYEEGVTVDNKMLIL